MTKATTKTMWFWWNWKMKVRYTDVSRRTYFTDIPHFQVCDELVIQASLLTTESPKGLAYSAQDDQGEVKLSLWILLSASPQVYRPVRPKNFELCWHWKWIVLNLSELLDMEIWKNGIKRTTIWQNSFHKSSSWKVDRKIHVKSLVFCQKTLDPPLSPFGKRPDFLHEFFGNLPVTENV